MKEALLMMRSVLAGLKQLHAKDDTTNFNVLDYISAFGTPLYALAYSHLFWPNFIDFDGMVFLDSDLETEADRERVKDTLSKLNDRTEVEKALNTFEVPSGFFNNAAVWATPDEQVSDLAERMRDMWASRLRLLFADRELIVELLDVQGEELSLRFFTKR
jgi:hypothetical protein